MPRGVDRYDEARIQGRLWTPLHLHASNRLVAYWDAGDISTLSFSGTDLTQLRDKSGNGRHLSGVINGFGPTWSPTAFRGRPGAINNYQGWLGTTSFGVPNTVTLNVFFLVTDWDYTTNSTRLVSMAPSGGFDFSSPSVIPLIQVSNGSSQLMTYATGQRGTNSPPLAGGTKTGPFIASSIWTATTNTLRINGTTGTPATVSFPGFPIDGFAIGNSADNNALGYSVLTTGQCVAVSGLMTDDICTRVEGAMVWSHMRSGELLGSGHPYANRPPLI